MSFAGEWCRLVLLFFVVEKVWLIHTHHSPGETRFDKPQRCGGRATAKGVRGYAALVSAWEDTGHKIFGSFGVCHKTGEVNGGVTVFKADFLHSGFGSGDFIALFIAYV